MQATLADVPADLCACSVLMGPLPAETAGMDERLAVPEALQQMQDAVRSGDFQQVRSGIRSGSASRCFSTIALRLPAAAALATAGHLFTI